MKPYAMSDDPPRAAVWLVNLFARVEEAESILGDLQEEFKDLASKSGPTVARSWYWRQSAKTITHLYGAGLRVAPWRTAASAVGGLLLARLISGLPERAIFAVLHRYRVYDHHFGTYVFFAADGIAIGHVVASMIVACMVALVCKGREMAVTLTLGFVGVALIGTTYLVMMARGQDPFLWMLPWHFADTLALVIGGAIVRTSRLAARTRLANL